MRMLMSPRSLCFPWGFLNTPPNMARARAVLMSSCPKIEGAMLFTICDRVSLLLQVSVLVNRNLLTDSWMFGELSNGFHVILGQSSARKLILFLADMIDFNHSSKDREPIAGVERDIKVITVDTSHLDLFTGSSTVDQIPQHNQVF